MTVICTLDQSGGNRLLEFFTARQRNCAKVTFSVVYVCLSVHRSVSLYSTPAPLPTQGSRLFKLAQSGPIAQGPIPLTCSNIVPFGPHCTGPCWTCSNLFNLEDTGQAHLLPRAYSNQFTMNHGLLISGQFAFYRNVFLLVMYLCQIAVRDLKQQIMSYNPNEFGYKFSWRMLGKLNLKNIKNVSIWFQLISVLKPSNNWVSNQNLQCGTKHKLDGFF